MFTNVEGDWDEVMDLIRRCVETVAESAPRVSVVLKLDYRPGASGELERKVAAVEQQLGEPR
jgi:uncharacterized protein YqgV (UPF0045/DUF77 family)